MIREAHLLEVDTSYFFGLEMAQRPEAIGRFNNFLHHCQMELKKNFTHIIEIGTGCGGLSVLLALYSYFKNKHGGEPLYKFHSFDIGENCTSDAVKKLISNLGGNLHVNDVFENDTHHFIANLIQNNNIGSTLLLCDGGNKVLEVETFCPYMKPGDVIMAHDFFFDKEEFDCQLNGNTTWHACEITMNDIENVLSSNSIYPFTQEELWSDVVWFCGMKSE